MRATRAEVSLKNIEHNIRVMRSGLKPETKYLAVIKGNAYGHGLVEVGRFIEQKALADYFAVAIAEEAFQLRDAGVTRTPILVLGPTFTDLIDEMIDKNVTATVFTMETLRALEEHAARKNAVAHFHFKIDTGMSRIGFRHEKEFSEALSFLKSAKHLSFDGMFTHFAVAEIEDKAFTYQQAAKYDLFAKMAKDAGFHFIEHVCNSAATLELPELQHDMCRGGISMYGYYCAGADPLKRFDLKPCLTWKTVITNVKSMDPGETVGYGRRFTVRRPSLIATLPVGYADGYFRASSGKALVLVHGKRCPQIGSVCMDQFMIDVTDVPDVSIGDEVILLGKQGDEEITADEIGSWSNTISYEVLLEISARVPRVYID